MVYAQAGAIAQAHNDFEAALEGAQAAGNRADEVQALNELGFLLAGAADYRVAMPLFEAALPITAALDDKASQVSILSRMSIVYTNRLQFAQALEHGYHALALAHELEDKRALALAMDSLQVATAMIGDFATIDEVAPQLVAIHRYHGDLWYLQFALYQWCYVPIGAEQWDDAIARLEEALAINRRIGDRGNEPLYLATLGWFYRSCGDHQQALAHGRAAVILAEELGHAEWTAWSEAFLGWTLLEVYALEEAVRHLEQGMAAAERAGARNHLLRCISQLAWAYWLLGEAAHARALAMQAEAMFQQITTPPGKAYLQGAYAYMVVARVLLADGQAARASQLLAPVLIAAEACGWQEAIAHGSLVIGQCLVARGDEHGAESALRRALQVALEAGLPGVAWEAHAARVAFHRAAGRLGEAEDHLTQAKAIIERLSTTLDDETMRQGFLHAALSHLG
jgi:tetratricopeptide (TPR) repeat protein